MENLQFLFQISESTSLGLASANCRKMRPNGKAESVAFIEFEFLAC